MHVTLYASVRAFWLHSIAATGADRSSSSAYIDVQRVCHFLHRVSYIVPTCQPRRAYLPSRDRSCGNSHSNLSNDYKTMPFTPSSKRRRPAHARLHPTRSPRRPSRISGGRRLVRRGKERIGEIRRLRMNTRIFRVRGPSILQTTSGIIRHPEGTCLPVEPTRARRQSETTLGSPLVSVRPSTRVCVVRPR